MTLDAFFSVQVSEFTSSSELMPPLPESFEDMLRWLPDNPDSGLSVDEDSVVVTKGKTWQMVLGQD